MRAEPRRRRYVHPSIFWLLRPLFRFSPSRGAYVLRLIGRHRGPVVRASAKTAAAAEPIE